MKPWWTLDEAAVPVDLAALDLFALPANEVPRPGEEGWVDPIDPRDLGPLSDEPEGAPDSGTRKTAQVPRNGGTALHRRLLLRFRDIQAAALPASARAVLLSISMGVDSTCAATISLSRIASDTAFSTSTVRKAITLLCSLGWLIRITNGSGRVESSYRVAEDGRLLPHEPVPARSSRWGLKRERVLRRDGWRCRYCGTQHDLTIDHVVPVCQGGGDEEANIVAACRICNSRKNGRTPAQAGMNLLPMGSTDVR